MQWKARIAFLNAGLDGSIIILQTLSHLSETNSVFVQQSLISNAMVRFLNLICAAKDDKQGTFVQSAKSLGMSTLFDFITYTYQRYCLKNINVFDNI